MGHVEGPLSVAGAIVGLKVAQSTHRVEALKRVNRPYATPFEVLALVDTGASCLCLDARVVHLLDLSQRGAVSVQTPSTGSAFETLPTYDVSVVLGDGQTDALADTCEAVCCDFSCSGFQAIIGRNLLNRVVLTYDGPVGMFRLDW